MAINTIGRGVPPPPQGRKSDASRPDGAGAEVSARSKPEASTAANGGAGMSASSLQGATAPTGGSTVMVDKARVEALAAAIADGSYKVEPEQVARAMLDFEARLGGAGDEGD
ncbi:MAG: flagellar biosynthesis anti-sigma factor FlgM [Gammaproteobacteria bacterium]